jgi:hypothetical protein
MALMPWSRKRVITLHWPEELVPNFGKSSHSATHLAKSKPMLSLTNTLNPILTNKAGSWLGAAQLAMLTDRFQAFFEQEVFLYTLDYDPKCDGELVAPAPKKSEEKEKTTAAKSAKSNSSKAKSESTDAQKSDAGSSGDGKVTFTRDELKGLRKIVGMLAGEKQKSTIEKHRTAYLNEYKRLCDKYNVLALDLPASASWPKNVSLRNARVVVDGVTYDARMAGTLLAFSSSGDPQDGRLSNPMNPGETGEQVATSTTELPVEAQRVGEEAPRPAQGIAPAQAVVDKRHNENSKWYDGHMPSDMAHAFEEFCDYVMHCAVHVTQKRTLPSIARELAPAKYSDATVERMADAIQRFWDKDTYGWDFFVKNENGAKERGIFPAQADYNTLAMALPATIIEYALQAAVPNADIKGQKPWDVMEKIMQSVEHRPIVPGTDRSHVDNGDIVMAMESDAGSFDATQREAAKIVAVAVYSRLVATVFAIIDPANAELVKRIAAKKTKKTDKIDFIRCRLKDRACTTMARAHVQVNQMMFSGERGTSSVNRLLNLFLGFYTLSPTQWQSTLANIKAVGSTRRQGGAGALRWYSISVPVPRPQTAKSSKEVRGKKDRNTPKPGTHIQQLRSVAYCPFAEGDDHFSFISGKQEQKKRDENGKWKFTGWKPEWLLAQAKKWSTPSTFHGFDLKPFLTYDIFGETQQLTRDTKFGPVKPGVGVHTFVGNIIYVIGGQLGWVPDITRKIISLDDVAGKHTPEQTKAILASKARELYTRLWKVGEYEKPLLEVITRYVGVKDAATSNDMATMRRENEDAPYLRMVLKDLRELCSGCVYMTQGFDRVMLGLEEAHADAILHWSSVRVG